MFNCKCTTRATKRRRKAANNLREDQITDTISFSVDVKLGSALQLSLLPFNLDLVLLYFNKLHRI